MQTTRPSNPSDFQQNLPKSSAETKIWILMLSVTINHQFTAKTGLKGAILASKFKFLINSNS